MKNILKAGMLSFAIISFATACNNDNGSSVSKGDPAIVHGGDSSGGASSGSSSGTSSSPGSSTTPGASGTGAAQANGNSNSSNVTTPAASTPDSGNNKMDSSKSKAKKKP